MQKRGGRAFSFPHGGTWILSPRNKGIPERGKPLILYLGKKLSKGEGKGIDHSSGGGGWDQSSGRGGEGGLRLERTIYFEEKKGKGEEPLFSLMRSAGEKGNERQKYDRIVQPGKGREGRGEGEFLPLFSALCPFVCVIKKGKRGKEVTKSSFHCPSPGAGEEKIKKGARLFTLYFSATGERRRAACSENASRGKKGLLVGTR